MGIRFTLMRRYNVNTCGFPRLPDNYRRRYSNLGTANCANDGVEDKLQRRSKFKMCATVNYRAYGRSPSSVRVDGQRQLGRRVHETSMPILLPTQFGQSRRKSY